MKGKRYFEKIERVFVLAGVALFLWMWGAAFVPSVAKDMIPSVLCEKVYAGEDGDFGTSDDGSTVYYVSPEGDDTNSGLSWAEAKRTIQAAIDACGEGESCEIWVKQGTYYESVTMREGVDIYGGFAGDETSREERDWEANKTVIDGQGEAYHVVIGAGDAVVDGFTITGGNADGGGVRDDMGGGLYGRNCPNMVIRNCDFVANHAKLFGGSIYNRNCQNVVIENCVFEGNSADNAGGGIYNQSSSNVSIINCIFRSNNAGSYGGGIWTDSGELRISNCEFYRNQAGSTGGALYASVLFKKIIISNTIFAENEASYDGGALYYYKASPILIMNCNFTHNYCNPPELSWGYGGAIHSYSSVSNISNCLFNANFCKQGNGGAICYQYNRAIVTNCTFYENSGDWAKTFYINAYSSATIKNCIIWGEELHENEYNIVVWYGSTLDMDYTNFQGEIEEGSYTTVSLGENMLEESPLFFYPAGPDGIPGTLDDQLRLRHNSPCVDTGDNSALPEDELDLDDDGNTLEDVPFDLAGENRVLNTTVDMGAYEYFPICSGEYDFDRDVDGLDLCRFVAYYSSNITIVADLDEDGETTRDDVAVFAENFGKRPCP